MNELRGRSIFYPDERFKKALVIQIFGFSQIISTYAYLLRPNGLTLISIGSSTLVGTALCGIILSFFVLLNPLVKKDAEASLAELKKLISSGTQGELVIVKKAGSLTKYFPRFSREAHGEIKHSVEYYDKLNEELEAYLFHLTKNPLKLWKQATAVVLKSEYDKFRTQKS